MIVRGRYPSPALPSSRVQSAQMTLKIQGNEDHVVVRLDDAKNEEFWLEIVFSRREWQQLRQIEDLEAGALEVDLHGV
jgi:hypothetical protein